MPQITCPYCQLAQIAPREMEGLTVACKGCGRDVLVRDGGAKPVKRPKREQVVVDEEAGTDPMDWRGLAKAGGLLGGLVLVVGLVFGAIVLIKRQADAPPPPTAPAAREPDRGPQAPATPARAEQATRDATAVAAVGAASVVAIVVFLAVVAYLAAVLLMGGWVARDAYARGMNGLSWAVFYYAYQLIVRFVGYAVAAVPAAVASLVVPGIGLMALVGAEAAAWCGFFAYLYARRQGRMVRCRVCECRRLDYLPECPHCGADGGIGSNANAQY